MTGTTLYPLNKLKETHPELYAEHAAKYKGRESVMEKTIPGLGCLWNDVLHFTAVDPQDIKQALIEAGAEGLEDKKMFYYKIPATMLNPDKTTVYLYKPEFGRGSRMTEDNFAQYSPDGVQKYSTIPEETKLYYRETISEGKSPLLFVNVPHILYLGEVEVGSCEVIE